MAQRHEKPGFRAQRALEVIDRYRPDIASLYRRRVADVPSDRPDIAELYACAMEEVAEFLLVKHVRKGKR